MLADLIRTGVIADAQDGLLRRPPVGPRADPRAAHLRRLPARRRRHPDRRACSGPRSSPPEQSIEAAEPFDPVPPPVHRAAIWRAARSGLAGVLLDDSRHPEPLPAAEAVGPAGQPAPAPAERAGRLGRGRRAGPGDAGPGQLGRPAAGGVRRAGPAQRRGRAGGPRDPRSGRWTEPADAGPAALPLPGRRRGRRARPPAPAGLPRPGRASSASWRPTTCSERKQRPRRRGSTRPG